MSSSITTPSTFLELVAVYDNNLMAHLQKTIDTDNPAKNWDDEDRNPPVPMHDWVAVHKVKKHLAVAHERQAEGDLDAAKRAVCKAAHYAIMRLEEVPVPLSQWAQEQMKATPFRASKQGELFFPCLDGDGWWRWSFDRAS